MGCDCGCGGTCPLCSRMVSSLMAFHRSEILAAATTLEFQKRKRPAKRKGNKKKKKGK